MNNFNYTDDNTIMERLSEQRDAIYEGVVDQFRVLMAQDNIDGALALADEFFEWMDPDQLENEPTVFYDERELIALYDQRRDEGSDH
jgi:hypothetical protein